MNESHEMKVTYIDPNQRALYVAELPDGGYGAWTQKGKDAPKKLRGGNLDSDGYPTHEAAQKALNLYVSQRRSQGASIAHGMWDIYVNGKRTNWDDYCAMCRGELPAPAELPPYAPVTLSNIEYRIAMHVQGAYENLLEIGRCLTEAKDSGLVPHGEWEGWVRRNTDMSERQAQRLMQAARSVKPGSMMERLPITKIQAILALPEPDREDMAEKAVDDNLSLRELQAAIKAQKNAEAELAVMSRRLESSQRDAQAFLTGKRASEKSEQNLRDQLTFRAHEIAKLEEQLAASQSTKHAKGISEEAQAEIDRLKAELDEAEAYAERQAELRQQAQRDMLESKAQEARGEAQPQSTALTAADLASAVRIFIGTAGVLPHMGAALARLSEPEKNAFRDQVNILDIWVEGSLSALGAILHVFDDDDV